MRKEGKRDIISFMLYLFFILQYFLSPNESKGIENIWKYQIYRSIVIIIYLVIFTNRNRSDDSGEKSNDILMEIMDFIIAKSIGIIIIGLMGFGKGTTNNQLEVVALLHSHPISALILVCVMAPIVEEIIFRFLPYQFIKNKTIYILFSSIIFSGLHVIGTPNALYHIPSYMIVALYLGYRYCETEDISVTIILHSFSNVIAALLILLLK